MRFIINSDINYMNKWQEKQALSQSHWSDFLRCFFRKTADIKQILFYNRRMKALLQKISAAGNFTEQAALLQKFILKH